VQVIPHITDEIKARIRQATDGATGNYRSGRHVGDIESLPFGGDFASSSSKRP